MYLITNCLYQAFLCGSKIRGLNKEDNEHISLLNSAFLFLKHMTKQIKRTSLLP